MTTIYGGNEVGVAAASEQVLPIKNYALSTSFLLFLVFHSRELEMIFHHCMQTVLFDSQYIVFLLMNEFCKRLHIPACFTQMQIYSYFCKTRTNTKRFFRILKDCQELVFSFRFQVVPVAFMCLWCESYIACYKNVCHTQKHKTDVAMCSVRRTPKKIQRVVAAAKSLHRKNGNHRPSAVPLSLN